MLNNALVIYDHITIPDVDYKQRIVDITEFFVKPVVGFDLYRTGNLTETLSGLAQRGYQWAVVNALGHAVNSPTIYKEIIDYSVENNYPVTAHIIFRPENYPSIDPQFVVVNLKTWQDLGSPAFEERRIPAVFDSFEVDRSPENAHHDYTPYWIKALPNTNKSYGISTRPFGSLVVQKFLEAGHTVNGISQSIRQSKWNLYPNINYEKLQPFFKDGTVTYNVGQVPEIIERVLGEKESLKNTVYILNSEKLYSPSPQLSGPIDHFIGVASGFKTVLLLNKHGFADHTKVTYVDVSTAGLDYQQYLINEWDGDIDLYQQTVDLYQSRHPEYRYAWRDWLGWNNEINAFLAGSNLTKSQFKDLWSRYRKLTFNFVVVDVLNNPEQLVNELTTDSKNVYIWLSNAFDMQYTRFLFGKEYTQQKFNQLLDQLKTHNCLVESCGRFYTVS